MPDETSRQRAVRLRLSGLSLAEVGEVMGLTRQRIEQLTKGEVRSIPGLNLTPDEAKALAQRYEREHRENESLSAWLRRLWIGEAE